MPLHHAGDRGGWLNPLIADEPGLVGIGGDLSPERLLEGYRRGVFAWYEQGGPIFWWSPDPRAIFELDRIHVPRRLARTIRAGIFRVTQDRAFAQIIRGCADRPEGTWLTPEMIEAYDVLHAYGHAHSVECWAGRELAGGIYGVALGGLFAGESMFARVRDASKVALVSLAAHLRQRGFTLFDIQFLNEHTARLGAVEIPRREYLRRLAAAVALRVRFIEGPP